MKSSLSRQFMSGSIWGIIVKIVDAAFRFFTIPILVSYFGKDDFGLITLAISLNTYLQIMDMGMNIGVVRYFSIWLTQKDYTKITLVAQSSIFFYASIGFINALVILWFAYNPELLGISTEQSENARWLLLILAVSVVFSWISTVVTQLLTANNELPAINKSLLVSHVANLLGVIITVTTNQSLEFYFIFYTISNLIVLPINIYTLRKFPVSLTKILLPKLNWAPFKEIISYSVSIFAMGLFQFSANHLRPFFLTRQSIEGVAVLIDYRVMQTISSLVMTLGGVLLQVLLPVVSQLFAEGNTKKIEKVVFEGTKIATLFTGFLCFSLITCSREILYLYMGAEYQELSTWLGIWLFTSLLMLHISPITSVILATGKIKILIYMTIASCIISLVMNYFLIEIYGVGGAVLGYLGYVVLMTLGYYIYYIPNVLKYSSLNLLSKSVGPSLLVGIISCITIIALEEFGILVFSNVWIQLIVKGALFVLVYTLLMTLLVYPLSEIKDKLQSIRE